MNATRATQSKSTGIRLPIVGTALSRASASRFSSVSSPGGTARYEL